MIHYKVYICKSLYVNVLLMESLFDSYLRNLLDLTLPFITKFKVTPLR